MIGGQLQGIASLLGVIWSQREARSKKQSIVARSNDEVEFRALMLIICELLWLKILLRTKDTY